VIRRERGQKAAISSGMTTWTSAELFVYNTSFLYAIGLHCDHVRYTYDTRMA
jgi:hypothetical protein